LTHNATIESSSSSNGSHNVAAGSLAWTPCSPASTGASPQSPQALSAEWRKAAERIGLGGVTFHALRHAHASHLIAAGIDDVKIANRLGHSDPAITLAVYAHLFKKLGGQWRRSGQRRSGGPGVGVIETAVWSAKSMGKTRFVPPAATPSR
jgi:hypothetical protein